MKLANIFYNYLSEQEYDDGDDMNFDSEPEDSDNKPTERVPNNRPLTPNQIAKNKWRQEAPGVTNDDMNTSIAAFNAKKGSLKPFKGKVDMDGVLIPEETGNSPEIVALVMRYPDFQNANDINKLRDPSSYTWEQFIFILQKLNENIERQITDLNIGGNTEEERQKSKLEKWTRFPFKSQIVINDSNLIVIRVESVEEAVALGEYQYSLKKKCEDRSMNRWCITEPINAGGNLYSSYRGPGHKRAYYFLMDKSRDICDKYHISVLQPSRIDGPYVITDRRNIYAEERKNLSWERVLEVWPGLQGKQDLITYFDKTQKEEGNINLSRYNFNYRHQNDLAIQTNDIQTMYVHSGRDINSARVLSSFSNALKEDYVRRTTIDNYTRRFINDNPSKPFGMIQALDKENWKLLHNQVLINGLNIKNGVFDLYRIIIRTQLRRSFYDIKNDNIRLFENDRRKGYYGIMDLSTLKTIKDFEYQQEGVQKLVKKDQSHFRIWKYRSLHTNDYFYWLVPIENEKPGPNYLKAHLLSGDEGDKIIEDNSMSKPNVPNKYNPHSKQYGRKPDGWDGHDRHYRYGIR